jgi:SAM-dependent methyltransferase
MVDGHPLTPGEREEYEEDLISFCDRELDLLGDIEGLDVLYAGGSSLLWLEGLSQRIGESGSLTALEIEEEKVERAKRKLPDAELRAPVQIVPGDIFEAPFAPNSFDLAYSAGLFHELDVREEPPERMLENLVHLIRPGGRISTSDFVDTVPGGQVEEERLQGRLVRELFGRRFYGIGAPERLVALHEEFLADVRWSISAPPRTRHLDKLVLDEEEPRAFGLLPTETAEEFRARRDVLRERIRREGYTRAATLYVEGTLDI